MSLNSNLNSPQSVLKQVFGYDAFRPHQLEVIDAVLRKQDTLAVMPTGGGKSLCYQIPALLVGNLTVVVSPLIALMKDQVEQLRALGVNAVVLNSSIPRHEYQSNATAVQTGEARILFVAPETLLMPRTLELLATAGVNLLTIDEAHCISEWGHDFRPEYRRVIEARDILKPPVCLAMTATATPRVRSDIKSMLGFDNPREVVASFDRHNLFIEVVKKNKPLLQTEGLIERFKGQSGIIYCFSRNQVDELTSTLKGAGHSVRPYHAGLDSHERHRNQEAFIRDDVQIMVATIAFGMGINKPNVRFIIHYDLPKSIEGYYQEIGRAGRDGLPSHCVLLYSYADAFKLQHLIDQKTEVEREISTTHLQSIVRYAEDESNCRRRPLLAYFGETYAARTCGNCDTCTTDPVQTTDITVEAQKFLSCVRRTGERFGAGHVADVLLGNQTDRVKLRHHDTLSTFGIGKELRRDEWMGLSRQLIRLGLLDQDPSFLVLRLTETALDVLKRREQIMGSPVRTADQTRRRKQQSEPAPAVLPKYDDDLFQLLREKRKSIADASNVPPYVVFPDRTLIEMAATLPRTANELLSLHGVGATKMARYGEAFISVITEYLSSSSP